MIQKWVYPRACGGTPLHAVHILIQDGLSPRVRGNLAAELARPAGRGSIPARAGEPRMIWQIIPVIKVYPRACGGTVHDIAENDRLIGLSPRVRGEPCGGSDANVQLGVYPRACGGTDRRGASRVFGGVYPARAGEPMPLRLPVPTRGVYPRACGGTLVGSGPSSFDDGLSPRVRGNPYSISAQTEFTGSIPARAGEPGGHCASCNSDTVYPRACGGTPSSRVIRWFSFGLSPRVRGNLNEWNDGDVAIGSIPARAGEPAPTLGPRMPQEVYPRACGGTFLNGSSMIPCSGLSPRVRGNPDGSSIMRKYSRSRSIPARAGEPT